MAFFWGLCSALAGNSIIGLGNCLQKYALTKGLTDSSTSFRPLLSAKRYDSQSTLVDQMFDQENQDKTVFYTTTKSDPTNEANIKKSYSRFTDKTWFLGIFLVYLGELCGNWVALSLIPASIVTPLGILGVVVNAILARFILSEQITFRQQIGYMWILSGVLVTILFTAIAEKRHIEDNLVTGAQLISYMTDIRVLIWLMIGASGEAALIWTIREKSRKNESPLILYVIMTAGFGALTVVASKFLAMLLKCWLFAEGSEYPYSPHSTGPDTSYTRLVFGDEISTSSLVFSLLALVTILLTGICGQEICKQIALSKFSITQFQPMFYASHVTLVALSGMWVFNEVGVWWSMAGFALGILVIIKGATYLLGGEKKGSWLWQRQPTSVKRQD